MELTTADIRNIGYGRKNKEITKKLTPWLHAILGTLIVCTIALIISTTSVSPTTYITPDGDKIVIALDYATFNGQIMSKEVKPLFSPIVYVSGTILVLSIFTLLCLVVYAIVQTDKARNKFLDEWLREKGITDLS